MAALCITSEEHVFSWGRQGRSGCLGRPDVPSNEHARPGRVKLPGPACAVDAESGASAAVLAEGLLFMWGSNDYGRLGLEGLKPAAAVSTPHLIELPEPGVVKKISLGSLYSACIIELSAADPSGKRAVLCTWGYGGHGRYE